MSSAESGRGRCGEGGNAELQARPTVWWFAPEVAFGIAIVVSVSFQQTVCRDSLVPPVIALLALAGVGPLAWLDQSCRREFGSIARAGIWIAATSSLVVEVLIPLGLVMCGFSEL
ncbi:hypothetical protein [Gordonia hankookensis]|uniref:Uncharacterized protein n=1 Tax=Gordonia hankookensis TaxID=589403 RepID=A0ABR7WCS4_9ACTN|nr:hypothetical protein [Gordonia hankookensis]MBD1320590.1 hypothetical protein [Gordonia hankookensis]